ncbi:hypothetical protein V7O62_05000 [Methanolobus sp. ZRKC2]|uniref:hypothetical protein n=1 Tax=Methanolobus sp. ZRKC2 TaxID=3125783 RepID=UPI003255CC10
MLLDLWNYVVAEKIACEEIIDNIEDVQKIVDSFDIDKALDKDSWEEINILIEVEPDEDILPIRSKYGEKESYNIGINYLNYNGSLYYFLPDILASKLLSGKSPKIKRAFRFVLEGIQEDIEETEIYDVHVNPKEDNLIKVLVEAWSCESVSG